MEGSTDGSVSGGSRTLNYGEAMKVVAAPIGTVLGLVALVFWFAAESWVAGIVRAEIAAQDMQTSAHGSTLTEHDGRLTQHDEEIEDNEEDIDENRQEFREFVIQVIDKL